MRRNHRAVTRAPLSGHLRETWLDADDVLHFVWDAPSRKGRTRGGIMLPPKAIPISIARLNRRERARIVGLIVRAMEGLIAVRDARGFWSVALSNLGLTVFDDPVIFPRPKVVRNPMRQLWDSPLEPREASIDLTREAMKSAPRKRKPSLTGSPVLIPRVSQIDSEIHAESHADPDFQYFKPRVLRVRGRAAWIKKSTLVKQKRR